MPLLAEARVVMDSSVAFPYKNTKSASFEGLLSILYYPRILLVLGIDFQLPRLHSHKYPLTRSRPSLAFMRGLILLHSRAKRIVPLLHLCVGLFCYIAAQNEVQCTVIPIRLSRGDYSTATTTSMKSAHFICNEAR